MNVSFATLSYGTMLLEDAKQNSTVVATCDEGYEHVFNETVQTFECTNQGWDISDLQHCTPGENLLVCNILQAIGVNACSVFLCTIYKTESTQVNFFQLENRVPIAERFTCVVSFCQANTSMHFIL